MTKLPLQKGLDPSDKMYGPLLKLERAEQHIREVEAIFRADIARNAKAFRPQGHRKREFEFIKSMPRRTATVIGDAVHNIRVSLDHAYWVAVENDGGAWHRNIKFPFGGDKTSIAASLRGQPKRHRPSDDVVKFILNEVEPFPTGKLELYDLHTLDITDKHQILLPARVSFTIDSRNPLILRAPDGSVYRKVSGPDEGATFVLTGDDTSVFRFDAELTLEYSGNLQNAVGILFGQGPMENRPIAPTLRMLLQNTNSVIVSLRTLLA